MGFSLRRLWSPRDRGTDNGGRETGGEIVRASRMARKEEVAAHLKEGFENLSTLLGTINSRLEVQQDRSRDVTENVRDLPDLLRNIHQQILNQQQTFSALRDSLLGVERAIETQSTTLRELENGYRETVESFHGSQDKALAAFQRSQRDTLESFRRNHERQGRQFEEVLKQTQHAFTKLLLIFFVATMGAVLLAILFTRSPL
jgi:hypothetical protein